MLTGLRARIVLLTVPPLITLTAVSLWMINRNVSAQAHGHIHDELRRSSAVFENMLHQRSNALATEGAMIVRDPKFFAVLGVSGGADDREYRATVRGVAHDFNRITQADLFEVLDAHGRLMASVGPAATTPAGRAALARDAVAGRPAAGLIAEEHSHYQAVVTPVYADQHLVGALLLGEAVGRPLAEQLRDLTHTEVSFFEDGQTTGSTLESEDDRAIALTAATVAARGAQGAGAEVLDEHSRSGTSWVALAGHIPGATDGRHLYVLQRSLDLETAFLRPIRVGLILLGLLAAALVVMAGVVIAQGITSPIARLVRASEAMELGRYDYPVEIASRDEIGTLARRFELMRSRQRAVVESLKESARVRREFISVASHELRTPISVIQGFHELLHEGALGLVSEAQHKALEAIGRAVGTLSRIAGDATRMAQVESDDFQVTRSECAIADLVADAVRGATETAPGRHVKVFPACEPADLAGDVDRERLAEALACLVRNGIRFTPDGGRVDVRARAEAGALVLEVQDTGVGIAPDRLEHLMQEGMPLQESANHHSSSTLEFNSAGLGLGLAIARGIVKAHAGQLTASSRVGAGSTFVLALPGAVLAAPIAA